MAGLLGQDQWTALGLLGGGLMQKNPGAGFGAALQYLDGARGREMEQQYMQAKLGLLGAQLKETEWQAKEREANIADKTRKQEMISRMFPNGIGAPEVSPGAFAPSPSLAGPMGPTMPPSMSNRAAPGSRLANMGFDDLAALKVGAGLDLTELHKYANDPLKLEGGSIYRDRVTGEERHIPKLPEGMTKGADGFYGFAPGVQQSLVGMKAAETEAVEGAKARHDLVQVFNEQTQRMEFVPRAQAVRAAQPAPQVPQMPPAVRPMPPASASEAGLRTQVVGGMGADPQAIQREIQQTRASLVNVKDPASRAQLEAHIANMERQAANLPRPMAAGPSMRATTNEAAEKERLIQQAKDLAEQRKTIVNAGFVAPTNIARYQQIGKLLQDVDGGKLTPAGTEFASALNSVGIKVDKNLSNKEAAAAFASQAALELRNPAGGAGMPGAMSDADRNFLVGMTPNMAQSAQGRKMVIDSYVAVQHRNTQVADFARKYEKKYGKLDNGFFDQLQQWSNANPLFKAQ
jgi:hypothetical protein